jgi:hypothetical protein
MRRASWRGGCRGSRQPLANELDLLKQRRHDAIEVRPPRVQPEPLRASGCRDRQKPLASIENGLNGETIALQVDQRKRIIVVPVRQSLD